MRIFAFHPSGRCFHRARLGIVVFSFCRRLQTSLQSFHVVVCKNGDIHPNCVNKSEKYEGVYCKSSDFVECVYHVQQYLYALSAGSIHSTVLVGFGRKIYGAVANGLKIWQTNRDLGGV